MGTDLVLDLFKRTPAAEEKKKGKEPTGQKSILAGLEDLPTEEEYSNLDVSSFLSST
jgi:TATA-binding protein-associated factor